MQAMDLLILGFLLVCVISAFVKGLIVELFSLAGVLAGLPVAAAEYGVLSPWIAWLVHNQQVANLVAFLLIELVIALVVGAIGHAIRAVVQKVGLGFIDRLLGAVFGLVKGCVVITLVVLGLAAFLPRAAWLKNSKLAPAFLSAAHQAADMTPHDLGEKARAGLRQLGQQRRADPILREQ